MSTQPRAVTIKGNVMEQSKATLGITLMAVAAVLVTGCSLDEMKRVTDPAYAERERTRERVESEAAYWAEQVVKGSPDKLDTRNYERLVLSVRDLCSDRDRFGQGRSPVVEAAVASRLLDKGYTLVERSDLDRVVREMGLQRSSGLTDTADVVAAGKMLNAGAILMVDVVRNSVQDQVQSAVGASGGNMTWTTRRHDVGLVAKVVDIRRGAQVWTASYFKVHPHPIGFDPQKSLTLSAEKLADAFPAFQAPGSVAPAPVATAAAAKAAPAPAATAPATVASPAPVREP